MRGFAPLLGRLAQAARTLHPPRTFRGPPPPAPGGRGLGAPAGAVVVQGAGAARAVPVHDWGRAATGAAVELPGDVFDVPLRRDVLQRVVRWQLAGRQQGTHKAKTRAEVRGGGRKPWAQKGTGRARQGSIRAPQWRGGGAVFGPTPRDHSHRLPKKVRRLGLKVALSARNAEGRIIVMDSVAPASGRTGDLARWLAGWGHERLSYLIVDAEKEGEGAERLRQAAGNLQARGVEVLPARGLNVYSILRKDWLIMSRDAVDLVAERLRREVKR